MARLGRGEPFLPKVGFPPVINGPLQYARPTSDVSDGSWTKSTGGNTDLYTMVDETITNDTDYILSNTGAATDVTTMGFGGLSTPIAGSVSIQIRYREGA